MSADEYLERVEGNPLRLRGINRGTADLRIAAAILSLSRYLGWVRSDHEA